MQKSIIRVPGQEGFGALAIVAALALSAPASADNANVTVYGQANVSYDMINTGTASGIGSSAGVSSSRVSSNSSRLGLKGSSELGSGWSALWQMEATVGADTGATGSEGTIAGVSASGSSARSTRLFDRDTYLGVSNAGWGKVVAGRHDTPYKMSTRRLDVFADGIADNRSLMGTTVLGGVVTETFDTRLSNQILYLSPDLGGFSIAIGYVNLAESNTNASHEDVSSLSLAGMYEQGPVYVSFAYEAHTTTLKEASTAVKAAKLGAGYKLGILDLGFAYEKSTDELGNVTAYDAVANPCGGMEVAANCSGHGTMYFSAKLSITEADAFKIAYSRAGQVGAASTGTGALQFSMGLDHKINERTTLYGLYTSLKNDKQAKYGLSNAASSGVYSVNTSGAGGASPSAFSFGLRHSF